MNWNADDLIMYVHGIFTNRKEDCGVCIVIVEDLLAFVDDYRQKEVKQSASLYAPHCDEDEDKKKVRKERPHFCGLWQEDF